MKGYIKKAFFVFLAVLLVGGMMASDGLLRGAAEAVDPPGGFRAKLDLVFVIDTTGSMEGTINGVKNNVATFATQVVAKGIDLRTAVIEFKDIAPMVDGLGSTIVHSLNGQVWQTNIADLIKILNRLSASGGGDIPETPIDALGYLPQPSMGWRSDARRFAFLFTDADYHNDNRHGYTGMPALADALRAQNINAFVVSDPVYRDDYRPLYERAGGIFMSIYGNYVDIMMQLAEEIVLTVLQVNYLRDLKFPEGKFWNKVGVPGGRLTTLPYGSGGPLVGTYQDGYTSSPCPAHGLSVDRTACNFFAPGSYALSYQCMGFADKLQFDVYGYDLRGVRGNLNVLKPGDQIRFNGHSIFVIAVNGDLITFADCNGASKVGNKQNCQIWWEKTITKGQITKFEYVQPGPYTADQVYNIMGKRVRIACPVDVEVYNSYGELIARIAGNEVDCDIPAEIAVAASVINGDEKEFILPRNISDFTIKITGTDHGTMDFSIADIDQATMSVNGTVKEFVNIAIAPGKSFETTIPVSTDAGHTRLFVTVGGAPVAEVQPDGTESGGPTGGTGAFKLVVNGVELSYEIIDGVMVIKPAQAQMAAILAYAGKENVFDLRGSGIKSVDIYVAAGWFKDIDENITITTEQGTTSVKTKTLWNNSGKTKLIQVRNNKLSHSNI